MIHFLCASFCVVLEDVFVLRKKDEKNPEIFGLFSTTRCVRSHVSLLYYVHFNEQQSGHSSASVFLTQRRV